jgi:hypothetical protein
MEVDLVARLREYGIEPGRYWLDNYALQAATELERLQEKCKYLEAEIARLERLGNG